MLGDDNLFEKLVHKGDVLEQDENKNVDEQEVKEEEDLAGKFGVFGYVADDTCVHEEFFDTEEVAMENALELAEELGYPSPQGVHVPLDYIEVWQADEEGRFGVSGEPIWKRGFEDELAKEESKTDEEIEEENKVDTVSNDPVFERTVEEFAQVEKDENKNVDEHQVKEGLEKHVMSILDDAGVDRDSWGWEGGPDESRLEVLDKEAARKIMKVLDDSGEIGETSYDEETKTISFAEYKSESKTNAEESVDEEVKEKDISREKEWSIYIPEEGEWPINYGGDSKEEAKAVYLKWANRKRLPAGSKIWCMDDLKKVKEEVKK